jgi:hypothetical protein
VCARKCDASYSPVERIGSEPSSLTTYFPLPTTYFPLPTTHYPLPTTHYLLPTAHYPLPTTYLLSTAYCLLASPTLDHLTSKQSVHGQRGKASGQHMEQDAGADRQ